MKLQGCFHTSPTPLPLTSAPILQGCKPQEEQLRFFKQPPSKKAKKGFEGISLPQSALQQSLECLCWYSNERHSLQHRTRTSTGHAAVSEKARPHYLLVWMQHFSLQRLGHAGTVLGNTCFDLLTF